MKEKPDTALIIDDMQVQNSDRSSLKPDRFACIALLRCQAGRRILDNSQASVLALNHWCCSDAPAIPGTKAELSELVLGTEGDLGSL